MPIGRRARSELKKQSGCSVGFRSGPDHPAQKRKGGFMRNKIISAVFAFGCLTACGGGGSSSPSPVVVATPPPAPTPTPTPAPLFTVSGRGDNVFTIPAQVTRINVRGVWDGTSTSNFIVRYRGSSLVNAILRDAPARTFEGTYAITGGGLVEITSSGQITWTFTEVR